MYSVLFIQTCKYSSKISSICYAIYTAVKKIDMDKTFEAEFINTLQDQLTRDHKKLDFKLQILTHLNLILQEPLLPA